ncbi:MAG: transporter substrate-binding domain-containing protein [Eubacteriales bacterium]
MRRMKMKKLIGIVLLMLILCATVTAFPGCSKTPNGVLKVGMECNYAPFNWTQPTDANGGVKISEDSQYAAGYDVEIAKKIADGLGMELQIVKIAWDGLSPALESGSIDLIIAGMSPTAERKEAIDFTDNYYKSNLIIVVKKDSTYAAATSLADFNGAKIVGQLGTVHADVISQISGVDEQDPMSDFSAMRVALQSGAIDGYVSEKPEGVSASAANTDLTFVEFAEGKGFTVNEEDIAVAVGIAKGKEAMIEDINEILAGITEDDRVTLMNEATANQPSAN